MNRSGLLLHRLIRISLVSMAGLSAAIVPAVAQNVTIQQIDRALVTPNSAERFFDRERLRLEQDIQQLQQNAQTDPPDLLKIQVDAIAPPSDPPTSQPETPPDTDESAHPNGDH